MRIFRKQFVVSKRPFRADETWRSLDLPDGWVLSYQEDLSVESGGGDAAAAIVLGERYRAGPPGEGAGRYVQIRWPRLKLDAAGLLGVFWARFDGMFAASSSPELALRALVGAPPAPDQGIPFADRHHTLINYVPSPGSIWSAAERLLPDEAIDFEVCAVVPTGPHLQPLPSFEAAVAQTVDELAAFAEELRARSPERVLLQLTAGIDSRTLAAACLSVGLRFETVTHLTEAKTDARVAGAISRRLGLRHHMIQIAPMHPERRALLERHISAAYPGWQGDNYGYRRPGDVIIAGGGFEFGHDKSHAKFLGDADFATATGRELWRRGGGSEAGEASGGALIDRWLERRRGRPSALPWLSQFYLDQRLGAWQASIGQSHDLLPGVVLNPANNPRIYAAVVTPDAGARAERALQREVIRRLAPELLAFPLNPAGYRAQFAQRRRAFLQGLRQRLRLPA